MAKKPTKKTAARKAVKSTAKKAVRKKTASGKAGKNKLGVKNSLVNNINARKKKKISRAKKKSSVSRKAYAKLKRNWK